MPPVTQKDIAKRLEVDVSTVNKILHRVPGAVFKKKTITLVMKTAREMGFEFDRYSKGWAMALLREIFPKEWTVKETAKVRNLYGKTVISARKVLYGK